MSDSGYQGLNEELLISLARELTDTAAVFREVRNSNSSVVIHAGGLTSAVAVCVACSTVVIFGLFAIWVMWQVAEVKGQQEAWIQVWQQRVATELKKD
jgi:hypothetical protein